MNNTQSIDKLYYKEGEVILDEIINQAYRLFFNKYAYGGINANNEIGIQCEFGTTLKTLGNLYEFNSLDKFELSYEVSVKLKNISQKSGTKNARIDILIKYTMNNKVTQAAIELKFFKKTNHGEPNNRYNVFKDLSNLEAYKTNGINLCYFILLTDHEHYVTKKDYSTNTADFNFSHGYKYKADTLLEYKTKKPYGPPIKLEQDYDFYWTQRNELYFLKLKI